MLSLSVYNSTIILVHWGMYVFSCWGHCPWCQSSWSIEGCILMSRSLSMMSVILVHWGMHSHVEVIVYDVSHLGSLRDTFSCWGHCLWCQSSWFIEGCILMLRSLSMMSVILVHWGMHSHVEVTVYDVSHLGPWRDAFSCWGHCPWCQSSWSIEGCILILRSLSMMSVILVHWGMHSHVEVTVNDVSHLGPLRDAFSCWGYCLWCQSSLSIEGCILMLRSLSMMSVIFVHWGVHSHVEVIVYDASHLGPLRDAFSCWGHCPWCQSSWFIEGYILMLRSLSMMSVILVHWGMHSHVEVIVYDVSHLGPLRDAFSCWGHCLWCQSSWSIEGCILMLRSLSMMSVILVHWGMHSHIEVTVYDVSHLGPLRDAFSCWGHCQWCQSSWSIEGCILMLRLLSMMSVIFVHWGMHSHVKVIVYDVSYLCPLRGAFSCWGHCLWCQSSWSIEGCILMLRSLSMMSVIFVHWRVHSHVEVIVYDASHLGPLRDAFSCWGHCPWCQSSLSIEGCILMLRSLSIMSQSYLSIEGYILMLRSLSMMSVILVHWEMHSHIKVIVYDVTSISFHWGTHSTPANHSKDDPHTYSFMSLSIKLPQQHYPSQAIFLFSLEG